MSSRRSTKRLRGLLAAAATAVAAALAASAAPGAVGAAPAFTITDLGSLGGGYSHAVAMNDEGQVVGYSKTANGQYHAFFWTADAGMVDLGTFARDASDAVAVNAGGEVVGESTIAAYGHRHAFSWTADGGMVDLGTLLDGGSSRAVAVNDSGQVAGETSTPARTGDHAFIWTEAGGMVDLGTLGGGTSIANDMNADGQVVGSSPVAGGPGHAFSWTEDGGMVDLGTLGGAGSYATAVNDEGQVVGSALAGGNMNHAFSWTKDGGIVDLGTLGGNTSLAAAVNDHGRVVGWSRLAGNPYGHAFSWTEDGGMVDLGSLGNRFTGYSRATAVNDGGQVVGFTTTMTSGGRNHAFSWTEAGGMVDLGTLGGGWSEAFAVDERGQVLGDSTTAAGETHAVLWEPAAAADTTAPVTSAAIDPAPNAVGWNATPVTVTLTATDEDGGSGVASVTYDTGAGPQTVSGGTASFSVTAEGETTLTYHATDAAGNDEAAHTLTVRIDETAPTISAPDVTADATSPDGTAVAYTATATDALDPAPSLSCAPASGSAFPIGDTEVACTATDRAGNTAAATFTVTVRGAADQIAVELAAGGGLAAKQQAALADVQAGRTQAACGVLGAYANQVRAQAGKKLSADEAARLLATVERVESVIGC